MKYEERWSILDWHIKRVTSLQGSFWKAVQKKFWKNKCGRRKIKVQISTNSSKQHWKSRVQGAVSNRNSDHRGIHDKWFIHCRVDNTQQSHFSNWMETFLDEMNRLSLWLFNRTRFYIILHGSFWLEFCEYRIFPYSLGKPVKQHQIHSRTNMFSQPLPLASLNLNWGEVKAALQKASNQNKILTQDLLSHFHFAYLYCAKCHTFILQPEIDRKLRGGGISVLESSFLWVLDFPVSPNSTLPTLLHHPGELCFAMVLPQDNSHHWGYLCCFRVNGMQISCYHQERTSSNFGNVLIL